MKIKLNLQLFAEEGSAGAAPEGGAAAPEIGAGASAAAESVPDAPQVAAGDTLPDGTKVQNARVAAALEKQMKRHPELRNVYGQDKAQAEAAAPAEKTIEERWEEAKKGEFAEQYGRDVQKAIKDRFKNQPDTSGQMKALEPMLKVLRDRAGVKTNEELIHHVMDDDSLYEEAASDAGMTVAAYKQFMEIKQQKEELARQQQESIRDQQLRNHFNSMQAQAERLKQSYPDFDLREAMNDKRFLKLTSPEVGVSVEDAWFAIHHKELAPQMLSYGMQRAKEQMGQTLQARAMRPTEGAMRPQGAPAAEMKLDPRKMTRAERNEIKRQVRLGRRVSFD